MSSTRKTNAQSTTSSTKKTNTQSTSAWLFSSIFGIPRVMYDCLPAMPRLSLRRSSPYHVDDKEVLKALEYPMATYDGSMNGAFDMDASPAVEEIDDLPKLGR